MSNNLIQWPKAKYWTKQWNPVIGCNPCSPACENCYAAAWAKRFGQSFKPHQSSQPMPPRKGIVFCGNMTDLFGDWMWPWFGSHDGYIVRSPEDIIGYACGKTHNEAIYLWLTKRVDNMVGAIDRVFDGHEWCKTRRYCHYFGFTAENQEWYDRRLSQWTKSWTDTLEHINGWLSCEPLLGPIDLHFYTYWNIPKWVVVGCESGPNRRPCKIEWVESIVEQCLAAKVPVFVKQLCLPNGKFTNKIEEFPETLQIRQIPWADQINNITP